MRFCDLFIEYKLILKQIDTPIPFKKCPRYRQLLLIMLIMVAVVIIWGFIAFWATDNLIYYFIAFSIFFIFLVVVNLVDGTRKNTEYLLEKHYKKYSRMRMESLKNLLFKYNIRPNDKEKLDLLLEEINDAKIKNDFLQPIKKYVKLFYVLVISVIAYTCARVGEELTIIQLLRISLVYCSVALIIVVVLCGLRAVKDWIFRDGYYYDQLASDIRQIKVFHSDFSLIIDEVNV